jgi:PAS domain S-box-containing protein
MRRLRWLAIAGSYGAAHYLGYLFLSPEQKVCAVWPASGVGLALLMIGTRSERRATLLILALVTLLSNLLMSGSLKLSFGFAAANTLELAIGAFVLSYREEAAFSLSRVRSVWRLTIVASVWTVVPALIGAATASVENGGHFARTFLTWWTSDALGILLVTPFVLSWTRPQPALPGIRRCEACLHLTAWAVAAWLVLHGSASSWPLAAQPYILLPLLAWTGIRLGLRGVTAALLAIAAAAVVSTHTQGEAFGWGLENELERLLTTQLYLVAGALQGLLLAASTTERKLAEAELFASGALLENFIRHSPAAVAMFDTEMRYLHVAERWLADYRLERESLIGRSHYELFPHLPERWKEVHRRVLAGAIESCDEDAFVTRDGSAEWLQWEARPWRKVGGEIGGLILFAQLITDRKRAQDVKRKSEGRLRTLIENASDMITVLNNEGAIRFQSPSSARILSREPEELLGTNVLEVTHPDDLGEAKYALGRGAAPGHDPLMVRLRLRHRDGSYRLFECIGRSVPDEAEDGFIVVNSRDITESTSLQEQLRQAQKLEALGTLAGGIAHDFNNILGAMLAFTEVAKFECPEDRAVQGYLDEVLRAGHRAADLVRQILSFSRRQPPHRTAIALRPVIEEGLALLRSTLPVTIALDADFGQELPLVLADSTHIHQVLMNLCTNAAHAMDGRGRLGVSLERFHVNAGAVGPHLRIRGGDYLRLTIRDTGRGMDAATAGRIFEPFFTTKQPGEGTGLGLAVVHGIVEEHEGAITVDTQPGRGACFTIYLPVARVSDSPLVRHTSEVPSGRGEKVLFVDDEPSLREAARHMLSRGGYEAIVCASAEEAWRVFGDDAGAFALVVSDLTMPNMTGLELAAKIHDERPDLPILLVSGYPGKLSLDTARGLGVREVLQKPLDCRTLLAAVGRMARPFRAAARAN